MLSNLLDYMFIKAAISKEIAAFIFGVKLWKKLYFRPY
jgi:hypothetical protein